jgi:hypothetical protein
MILALIGCLLMLAGYLGWRLSTVNTENTELRAQIASLKRKLVQRR